MYLLEDITLHLASPHTLESASANQAQPMQNTSKIFIFFNFFFHFSCRLEFCSAHNCTGPDIP